MKLFVDDIRQPPDETWRLATNIDQAIRIIEMHGKNMTHISLDHDISIGVVIEGLNRPYPSPDTFQAVARYMGIFYNQEEADHSYINSTPTITTHSSNPIGRREIVAILRDYELNCEETPLPICARKQP